MLIASPFLFLISMLNFPGTSRQKYIFFKINYFFYNTKLKKRTLLKKERDICKANIESNRKYSFYLLMPKNGKLRGKIIIPLV